MIEELRRKFIYCWGLAMSIVVMFTYILALLNGGQVTILVDYYHEAIWEFPLLGMGFVWYLFQLRKEMR
ncbi:hypothetical protein DRN85_06650 [Methanosarcinales archaeon]|nr:MAG: hypothetical protein DRN85_06650 [Methanosarcinales archaeon]